MEITNRGHLVAALVPVTDDDDPLAAMERAGQLVAPSRRWEPSTLPRAVDVPQDSSLVIAEQRQRDR